MKWLSEKEIVKIREFLKTPGKRILLYHNDADGACSAALLLKFYSGFECIVMGGPRIDGSFVKELAKKKPDLIVALDLPIDQEYEKLEKLKEAAPGLKMVVIDHHIFERNLNSEWTIHINPRFGKETYIPTSYVLYRILEKLRKNISLLVWIAAVGIIGDYDFKESEDLLKECRKKYPDSLSKDPFKSALGRAADIIDSAVTLKGSEGAGLVLKKLLEAREYKEFLKDKKLLSWHRTVDKEIKRAAGEAEENPEEYPDIGLIIYEIKTKLNVTSTISTFFAEKNPNKTVLIVKRLGNEWKISLRNQSGGVNVGDLAKKCVQGIGSGGGHKKAAGVLTSDWDSFKRRILGELEN